VWLNHRLSPKGGEYMGRKEISMRFLPVVLFAVVTLIGFSGLLTSANTAPLLVLQVVLMIVSFSAWIPKDRDRKEISRG
jgi:hypothetical protein